jgi:hypothetical protein
MKRFVVPATLILAVLFLASTAGAFVGIESGSGPARRVGPTGPKPTAPTPSSTTSSSSTSSESDSIESELTGTATASADGSSVTIVGANGASLTCAVPAGMDLTPFLTGSVEATCESVGGLLTLTEIKSEETGTEAENTTGEEPGDDDATEVEGTDECTATTDDEPGDDCATAGTGSGDDNQGDDDQGDDDQGDDGEG